jgi:hypothetical protein
MPRTTHLHKGRCVICRAHAAAKGDTLQHLPSCPERAQSNRAYTGIRLFLVTLYWRERRQSGILEIEAPDWNTARALLPEILGRDYSEDLPEFISMGCVR